MVIKRLKFRKLKNTRDIGGYPVAFSRTVKKNLLFRSGLVAKGTDKDMNKLFDELGIRTVIDLRTDAEINEKPEILPDYVSYVRIPLLDDKFLGIARDEYSLKSWFNIFEKTDSDPVEVFCDMYDMLVFGERTRELIPVIFRILIENEGGILWHCSAGKDRVGIVTMLVLLALGAERSLIVRDYIATRYFTAGTIIWTRFITSFILRTHRLRKCLAVLMGVKPVYIERILDKIDSQYDSVEAFFSEHFGITEDEIAALRNKYLC